MAGHDSPMQMAVASTERWEAVQDAARDADEEMESRRP
jgi:hypothetical protein